MPLYIVVSNSDSVIVKKVNSVDAINEIEMLVKTNSKFGLRSLPEGVIDLVYQDLVTDSSHNQDAISEIRHQHHSKQKTNKEVNYYYSNSPNFGKVGIISKNERTGNYELNGEGVKQTVNKSKKYLISYAKRTNMTLLNQ
jgi:hypothetical protein